jgi:uncharacterized protein (TIGR02996 family)
MPPRQPLPHPLTPPPHPEEQALLQGIVDNPGDDGRFGILADWLDEHDDPRRAELLRLHRRLLETCCEPDKHHERGAWQARVVELLGEGVRPSVPRWTVKVSKGIEMAFAWVPPGRFVMGSPPDEEEREDDETQHQVTLTGGFYLGVCPVTQAQWRVVRGTHQSRFQGDDLPVEQVSWDDCQAFCTELGEKVGLRFCLPTEAQWEYACRAGTTTPFHFGATLSTDQANYKGKFVYGRGKKGLYRKHTTPVGSFPPNAWGLCDMHGNVLDWCSDRYGPYLSGDIQDPQGDDSGYFRVQRGGSWFYCPWGCRSASRDRLGPDRRGRDYGCRLVLCLD